MRNRFSDILAKLKTAAHVGLAVTPSFVKLPIYRKVFGFRIARSARVGFSVLDVPHLELGEGARIGHGNLFLGSKRVLLDEGARVDHFNVVRGGDEVRLDRFAWVMRFNVLNSIPNNDAAGPTDPRLRLGPGACVVSGHRLDFTDAIELGTNVIVAGRNSSLWTHNRQTTQPIRIGDFCYLGSEVRLAPGAGLKSRSILGLGAVLTRAISEDDVFVAGVPARVVRPLTEADHARLVRKTRDDIPDDAY